MNRTVYFKEQLQTVEWYQSGWWAGFVQKQYDEVQAQFQLVVHLWSSNLPKFSVCVFIHAHMLYLLSVFFWQGFLKTPNNFLTWKKCPNKTKEPFCLLPSPAPSKKFLLRGMTRKNKIMLLEVTNSLLQSV